MNKVTTGPAQGTSRGSTDTAVTVGRSASLKALVDQATLKPPVEPEVVRETRPQRAEFGFD